jgi:hypothetical protein
VGGPSGDRNEPALEPSVSRCGCDARLWVCVNGGAEQGSSRVPSATSAIAISRSIEDVFAVLTDVEKSLIGSWS